MGGTWNWTIQVRECGGDRLRYLRWKMSNFAQKLECIECYDSVNSQYLKIREVRLSVAWYFTITILILL